MILEDEGHGGRVKANLLAIHDREATFMIERVPPSADPADKLFISDLVYFGLCACGGVGDKMVRMSTATLFMIPTNQIN